MTTSFRSFRALAKIQFKLFLREPLAFFFTLVFPLLLLLLFGAIWGNEPGSSFSSDYGYIDFQVPALTALIIGTVALMSIPVATATAREQHLLRRFRATPLRPGVYLASDVLIYFVVALLGMILLVVVATLVFGLRFSGNWGAVLLAFTLSALAFIAAGYLLASLAPTARSAQVIGQVIFFPMMFLSGAAMPLAIMPDGIQQVAQWLPLTYVVNLLQSLWFGQGWDMTAVAILVVMLVAGTLISIRVFRWE